LTPINTDRNTGYKNFVRNNICNTNKTTIPWINLKRLSDGNGIIIDVNQHAYNSQNAANPTPEEAYTGRTLVENNVSVNNGGSGIHSFKADHVDIINNTAYHNGTVVGYPDIFTNQCHDVNIINNIMYARLGGDCNSKPKFADEKYSHNIYFNGKVGYQGEGDVIADPQFANLSTDLILGNFNLKKGSPAIDQGNNTTGFFSQKDILGVPRPYGIKPDRGAYEFNNAPVTVITSLASLPVVEKATLYPNPATETFTLRLPENQQGKTDVEILNCNGGSVKNLTLSYQVNEVNVSQLPAGLYIVVVSQEKRVVSVHKLIKQ
ncbi:MAG: T9SS type A sorting domain-containing protein, partial [Runella zeae]